MMIASSSLLPADDLALKAIDSGEPVKSYHIVRLEMMGLVRDTASGPALTDAGRRALRRAQAKPASASESLQPSEVERDALGRRKGGKAGRNNRIVFS